MTSSVHPANLDIPVHALGRSYLHDLLPAVHEQMVWVQLLLVPLLLNLDQEAVDGVVVILKQHGKQVP